jgi:SAM-dependent methyltransferase
MKDHSRFPKHHASRLNDTRRLHDQVSEQDLARLLDLRGSEDVADLGSGTGFYTEIQPELSSAYRERGVPTNVRLVLGDMTALSLPPASVDVACTIATWHEIGGRLDLPGLLEILRPQGKLIVIDWRRDPDSWESGPPADLRSTKEEVVTALAPYFAEASAENLGRFMLAVVAKREAETAE